MVGRLGVFRINKAKTDEPDSESVSLVKVKRSVSVSWDTTEQEDIFGKSGSTELWRHSTYGSAKKTKWKLDPLDVFYLPVRVMDAYTPADFELPMLWGCFFCRLGRKMVSFAELVSLNVRNIPPEHPLSR
jgi:hypothetical protein